jgi:hypothetical protein
MTNAMATTSSTFRTRRIISKRGIFMAFGQTAPDAIDAQAAALLCG